MYIMRIVVTVKTHAKKDEVERIGQLSLGFTGTKEKILYKVSVKALPIDGKANEAVIRALAAYFDIPISCIQLISGYTYKQKIFEIEGTDLKM